jgi:hypothetical protein
MTGCTSESTSFAKGAFAPKSNAAKRAFAAGAAARIFMEPVRPELYQAVRHEIINARNIQGLEKRSMGGLGLFAFSTRKTNF